MKTSKHSSQHSNLKEPMNDSPGTPPLPSLDDEAQHSNGKQKDMSHVESYVDSLDDEEAQHAHKHLTKRLKPNIESAIGESPNITMDDYKQVMQGEE